ncbi:MAG: glycosyltransferase [Patescibacteria group bacterium]|jgi:glycosyltransferase involved in cell wall biosynthesis
MPKKTDQTWIVYLSTFPPRECGIGTFTQDLTKAIDQTFAPRIKSRIIALNTSKSDVHAYPNKVFHQIDQTDPKSYEAAAEKINRMPQVKCVNLQHEYGIHGGVWGENILFFLNKIKKPTVITLHTVIPDPENKAKQVTVDLLGKVSAIVVLTSQAKDILVNTYGVSSDKIVVIPHGIHPVNFSLPVKHKTKLKLKGRTVLSTFGFVSRGKGIEYVIKALPQVVAKFPNVLYLIIGETHPVVRREEGESYRRELLQLVKDLDLTDNVRFYDRYLSLGEIIQFLEATDIYVSTSLNPNQTVSGTLSYALGTGRAVVSTAFSQAKETITSDIGRLVDIKNPESYTNAFLELLNDKEKRESMHFQAFSKTRNMLWSNVAISYMNLFSFLVPEISSEEKNLPEININHLRRLTDSYGLFQFAKLTAPDTSSGYTIDDNARALIAAAKIYQNTGDIPALHLVGTYLRFLQSCQIENGSFINYVAYEQKPNDRLNSNESMDDANGRTVWALSTIITLSRLPKNYKKTAAKLLTEWLEKGNSVASLRSNAFIIKGLSQLKPSHNIPHYKEQIQKSAEFIKRTYEKKSSPDWPWFEHTLTYANGVLPEAMYLAYKATKNKQYLNIANESLNFLINNTFQGPIYVPIGQNGWYKKGNSRQYFDQQPEDVAAMVQSLKTAYQITKRQKYRNLMNKTFYWFLGNNLLGKLVYDKKSGGSHDALTPIGVNLHQGAESTVSYLISRLDVCPDGHQKVKRSTSKATA